MFPFKKGLYYLISIFAVYTLLLGIKVTISPAPYFTDIKLLGAGAVSFVFSVGILLNFYVRKVEKFKAIWLAGIIFSSLALLIWIYIFFGPIFNYVYQIAMIISVLAFTSTNYSVVNLAEKSSFFTPIFIKITKFACIITAIFMTAIILGWYHESEFTIKCFIISFLILHKLALRKKHINYLTLIPTDTNGIYVDNYGNQFLVKQINEVANTAKYGTIQK